MNIFYLKYQDIYLYLQYVEKSQQGGERQYKLQMPPVSNKVTYDSNIKIGKHPEELNSQAHVCTAFRVEQLAQMSEHWGYNGLLWREHFPCQPFELRNH